MLSIASSPKANEERGGVPDQLREYKPPSRQAAAMKSHWLRVGQFSIIYSSRSGETELCLDIS